EVDDLDTKPLEARLTGLFDVLGTAIHPVRLPLTAHLPKLARQYDSITPALDRTPDQILIVTPTVHVRGIEVVDTGVYGATDQVLGLCILRSAVNAGKRHAAKADR